MTEEVTVGSVPEQWKHGRLHEFQARLLERMNAARDGSGMRESRLGVMVGDRRCLLDLREAGEIVSLMPVTKVPLTKDWYLGLANVRGNLIGVVDLDRFLGGELQAPGKENRVIVVSGALSVTSGFMVSRVLGLRHIQEMTLRKDDKNASADAKNCYLDGDRNEWTEISLAGIVGDPRFLHVGL
ncbi:chemotaxis protein CheW [Herbaspirillum sp. RV1423]|uniref:chemotaxis protein CheW n=1 Tax=Herbaspirillum sp. RV1423 TaxID=1443993 RepID=UPI0004B824FF|nr:chemotaxis protein CheW [Herbaspirillum sp. RV1423]